MTFIDDIMNDLNDTMYEFMNGITNNKNGHNIMNNINQIMSSNELWIKPEGELVTFVTVANLLHSFTCIPRLQSRFVIHFWQWDPFVYRIRDNTTISYGGFCMELLSVMSTGLNFRYCYT